MELFYCDNCGIRIEQAVRSDAPRADGKTFCSRCAPAAAAVKPQPKRNTRTSRSERPGSGPRIANARAPVANTALRPRLWIASGIAAAAAAGVLIVVFTGHRSDAAQPVVPELRNTTALTLTSVATTPSAPAQPANSNTAAPVGAKKPAAAPVQTQSLPLDDEKAEIRFSGLFQGVSESDTVERIKRLEHFIAEVSPELTIVPRARVMLSRLKDAKKLAAAAPCAEPVPAPAGAAAKAALVGHWKLNDGAGAAAADSSGFNNIGAINGAQWTDAGDKRALAFDGKKAFLEIPQAPALNTLQDGDYSISAWFRPDGDPAPDTDYAHSGYSVVMKVGNHIGLAYLNNHCFAMSHWLSNDAYASAISERPSPPGAFYHIVGAVNKTKGETKVYVNGVLAGSKTFPANSKARDYNGKSWEIGLAWHFGEDRIWPAKGAIRDVRLYSGVLSEAEIKALNEAGKQ